MILRSTKFQEKNPTKYLTFIFKCLSTQPISIITEI